MTKPIEPSPFGPDHAAQYDAQWAKLAPMVSGLHFLSRLVLRDLPADARILCVGAGTGAELFPLAEAFPGWRFTAVEPAGPMLEVCRQKAKKAGIFSRCEFHEGYLDSLPGTEKFDGSTAVLVSQFLPDVDRRRGFFQQILKRLRPGGRLISADLATVSGVSNSPGLMETWIRALEFTGVPSEAAKMSSSRWGTDVAVLKPSEIESIIVSSGFQNPTLFYQSLFIHAWFSVAPTNK